MSSVYRNGSIVYLVTDDRQQFCYDSSQPPLGSGAMGTVYRGFDRHGRPVAIKRVNDRYSQSPQIRSRAKSEASLMFSHYNLVEMLGYCEVEPNRGPIFIISRFVQGDTLDKFVERNKASFVSPVQKICELFFPVFDALEYLHGQGVIHSDIKPSNIMVEAGHNVRLMDLGIAQTCEPDSTTGSGSLMGTPRYAAPEQFSDPTRRPSALDARTDIYGLGITIYEVLTGSNPFAANTVAETRRLHKSQILPYVQELPDRVVDVLRKATHPTPEYRFENVAQFKSALKNALNKDSSKNTLLIIWLMAMVIFACLIIAIFYVK